MVRDLIVFPMNVLSGYARSETEFHSILNLEWIRRVAGRAKSQERIGRQAQIGPSINRIQVRGVGAIEQVEKVAAELGDNPLSEVNRASNAQVKASEARPLEGVPPQRARPIRKRVAIAVGIRAGEDVEAAPGLSREQRAELEVTQYADARRDLTDEGERKPLRNALSRNGALRTDFGVFGDVRQVGYGL